jgi:transcriptional regulator with XRE-family HTH domain
MNFGQIIKILREEKGITQQEMANRMGLKQQSVAKYEKMENPPKLTTMQKIATGLDISIEDLYDAFHYENASSTVPLDYKILSYTGKNTFEEIKKRKQSMINIEVPPEDAHEITHLIDTFQSLNYEGQQRVISYMIDMSKIYSK